MAITTTIRDESSVRAHPTPKRDALPTAAPTPKDRAIAGVVNALRDALPAIAAEDGGLYRRATQVLAAIDALCPTTAAHTAGPWRAADYCVVTSGETGQCVMAGADTIADCYGEQVRASANARRIVACVNACEGIPTVGLEPASATTRGYSLLELRETLMDLVEQYDTHDSTALAESVAILRMNVSLLRGLG